MWSIEWLRNLFGTEEPNMGGCMKEPLADRLESFARDADRITGHARDHILRTLGGCVSRNRVEILAALRDGDRSFHELKALLMEVKDGQGQIRHMMEKMMDTLDNILADVTEESTKLDSLSAFIAGLKQQIADALAGTTLPPAVQAKVDAVFAGVEANKAKVQTALDANVTTTPTP